MPPEIFLKTARGHWSVENSLHHVKDRSWLEDKIYSKETEPGLVLGVLRNLSLNVIRGVYREKDNQHAEDNSCLAFEPITGIEAPKGGLTLPLS